MRCGNGLTLVETVTAVVIVGVMLVAALATVGASGAGQLSAGQRGCGYLLAQAMMAEVLEQPYEDPNTPVFGPEPGESTGTRAMFDDVDDYGNWSESPPESKDGTDIPDCSGFRRTVVVECVSPGNLMQVVASDSGIKRVTVRVYRNDVELACLMAIRTPGRDTLKE
jgi:type II secretory pathway pseudopilin PulG